MIDDVNFCVGHACDKQIGDAFQPSRLTGMRSIMGCLHDPANFQQM